MSKGFQIEGSVLIIFNNLKQLISSSTQNSFEHDMQYWRKKICNAVLYSFSFFGLITLIPSVVLSIREGVYSIAAASVVLYLFCIIITFYKNINYCFRTVSISILFYLVGLILLVILGSKGAGEVWLFSSTFLAALLLGNTGAFILFGLNTLTQAAIYFFLLTGNLQWDQFGITAEIWFVKGINFILLNLVIVIANMIFIRGFQTVISRSMETRDASIIGLAKLAEYRDNDTGNHLKRIQRHAEMLARELSKIPKYKNYITSEYIKDLYISSILHDIGKVGIQDAILLKPGSLSDAEFKQIKQHPEIGGNVISEIEKNINGRSLYSLAKEIALYHHERWDGSGYPEGLTGEEIPLSARIIALADVYDALTSKRSYKEAVPHQAALAIIKEGRGSQFDPEIVDVFLKVQSNLN